MEPAGAEETRHGGGAKKGSDDVRHAGVVGPLELKPPSPLDAVVVFFKDPRAFGGGEVDDADHIAHKLATTK